VTREECASDPASRRLAAILAYRMDRILVTIEACWVGPTINTFIVQYGFQCADPLPGILLGQPGEKEEDAKPTSIARVVTSTYKLTENDQG